MGKSVKAITGLLFRSYALTFLALADKLCGSKTIILPKGAIIMREHPDGTAETWQG